MNISLAIALNYSVFRGAEVFAGAAGLTRGIRRVSVFDCPLGKDIIDKKIIEAGDLFLSGLDQFHSCPEKIRDLLEILNDTHGSGLCVTDEHADLLSDEIRNFCNEIDFPLVVIDQDISYASIMDTINKLVWMNSIHTINELKLEKILYTKLSRREVADLLASINPNIGTSIQVFAVKGTFRSELSENDLYFHFLERKTDSYLRYQDQHLVLLSDDNIKALAQKNEALKQYLEQIFIDFSYGFGNVHDRKNVDKGLKEARVSLQTAQTIGLKMMEYDSMADLRLLMELKDSEELQDYYDSVMMRIRSYDSDNKLQFVRCIKEYVFCKGDYGKVAQKMNQHENTIRYRINKIKALLDMEDDTILFHETIALVVKIDMILQGKSE